MLVQIYIHITTARVYSFECTQQFFLLVAEIQSAINLKT